MTNSELQANPVIHSLRLVFGLRHSTGAAFRGKAVFLEATVGFVGDGGFHEVGVDGRVQVVGTESRAAGKLETLHAFHGGPSRGGEGVR